MLSDHIKSFICRNFGAAAVAFFHRNAGSNGYLFSDFVPSLVIIIPNFVYFLFIRMLYIIIIIIFLLFLVIVMSIIIIIGTILCNIKV